MLKTLEKEYGWSFKEVSPMQKELIRDVINLTMKTMISYKCYFGFYNGDYKILKCEAKPIEYKGYLIYHRIKHKDTCANVFDIVLNGVVKKQMATLNICKKTIDNEIL